MRPVNLIPEEERRGSGASTRAGLLSYAVIGVLVLALVAVSALVLLGNKISDKQVEVDRLEAQAVATEGRADSLAAYVSFQQVRESRAATIDSLAKSRFDWERIVRELSLVIPKNVWLSNLTGTVSPEVQIDDGAAIGLRTSVPGPALELVGCARSQPAIASLIAALHDIDGVTRVTAVNGIKTDNAEASTGGAAEGTEPDTGGTCPPSAPSFQVVAAFDAVAVEGADAPSAATPVTSTETTTSTSETTTSTTSETGTATPDGTETAPTGEQQAVEDAKAKATRATNLIPGAGG